MSTFKGKAGEPRSIDRIIGKTIAAVEIDTTDLSLTLTFDDKTSLSILTFSKPSFDVHFNWGDRDEEHVNDEFEATA